METHTDWLEERVEELDQAIEQQIQTCQRWQQTQQLVTSVPGVGKAMASTLMAGLPELRDLTHKQIATLVGVAPLNDDRGQMKGKRRVFGSRVPVRQVLYVSALVTGRDRLYNSEQLLDHTYRHYHRLGEATYLNEGKPTRKNVNWVMIRALLTICW